MSYTYSKETHSYSLQKPNTSDDIKKGLLKIKQAQIEVLRELRKDDDHNSRNHSLTYSKQTTQDSKPMFKFEAENVLAKHKGEKTGKAATEAPQTQNKFRQEFSTLNQEVRKYKEAAERAYIKMKDYQKGQERALTKAQEAIGNAITSQKKYLSIKAEYDKLLKQRQRLFTDLKKLQRKQISQLPSIHDSEQNLPIKIIKQLNSINQHVTDLLKEINNHKCPQKQTQTTTNSKKTITSSSSSSFTISTFDTQSKVDRAINNIIAYFQNIQNVPQMNGFVSGVYGGSDIGLSGSFSEDIRKIEEEMNHEANHKNQKMNILHSKNIALEKRNIKLETEIKDYQEEIKLYKNKLKALAKQLEDTKRSKLILEEEYLKYKQKTKEKESQKEKQLENCKKKQRNGYSAIEENPQKNVEREVFENRIVELEKQNTIQSQKLRKQEQNEKNFQQTVQKLKLQLQSALNLCSQKTFKDNAQWQQMNQTIKSLQQERDILRQRENQIAHKLQKQTLKYQTEIQQLEYALKSLRQEIQELRNENTDIVDDDIDHRRIKTQQTKQVYRVNKTVDELRDMRKQKQFSNLNNLLGEIKNEQSNVPKIQLSPPQLIQTTIPKSERIQRFQQSPRRSFDPSDRFLFNNYSPIRPSPSQLNMPQTKEYFAQSPQGQVLNPFTSIPVQIQNPVPHPNANIYHQNIQYPQQQYIVPVQNYRVGGYPQTILYR